MNKEKMKAIQQLFARETLEKIPRVKDSLAKLKTEPGDKDAYYLAYLFFYTVLGSGGSIGLDNITACVKPIEEKFSEFLNDERVPGDDLFDQANEVIDFLEERITTFLKEETVESQLEKTDTKTKPGYKIMVVDEDNILRAQLKSGLEAKDFEVYETQSISEAREKLDIIKPDLAILEVVKEEDSGLKLCKEIRANQRFEWMPVILLSNGSELADRVKGLKAGADDYITKPVEVDELLVKIEAKLKRVKDFFDKSIKDPLTGAYSREYFSERLKEEIGRYNRDKQRSFSIVIFDIDNFKRINDYGPITADSVLQEFAGHLVKHFRQTDVVARFGVDEFIVLMSETKTDIALKVIGRIQKAWANKKIVDIGSNSPMVVTFSAGITEVGLDASTEDDLFTTAYQAVYEAKSLGKNQVVAANESDHATEPMRLQILIVDDSIIVHNSLINGLEFKGYIIHTASDGHEAMALIRKVKPDVAIIDLNMPKLNGIQLAKEIREKYKNAELKIMAYTGESNKTRVIEALKAGVDDYLIKPIRVEELEKRILRLTNSP